MNTLKTLSTVVLSLLTFAIATAQNDELISIQSLPTKSQAFINQHFSANSIVSVWQDNEKGKAEDYTVLFANGTEVEFKANGEWSEVKSRYGAVSPKIIPAKIGKHVQRKYPKTLIKEIEKKHSKYEVKLSNGISLEFNNKGKFLKIDD